MKFRIEVPMKFSLVEVTNLCLLLATRIKKHEVFCQRRLKSAAFLPGVLRFVLTVPQERRDQSFTLANLHRALSGIQAKTCGPASVL